MITIVCYRGTRDYTIEFSRLRERLSEVAAGLPETLDMAWNWHEKWSNWGRWTWRPGDL